MSRFLAAVLTALLAACARPDTRANLAHDATMAPLARWTPCADQVATDRCGTCRDDPLVMAGLGGTLLSRETRSSLARAPHACTRRFQSR
jgi:hypothetical protein